MEGYGRTIITNKSRDSDLRVRECGIILEIIIQPSFVPSCSPILLFNPVGIYLDLRQMSHAPARMPTRLGIHAASIAGIAPPCPNAVVMVIIV